MIGALWGYVGISVAAILFVLARPNHRSARIAMCLMGLATLAFCAQRHTAVTSSSPLISGKLPTICIGDSLTSGMGPPGSGYPTELAKLTSAPVVDLGLEGITADDALPMLTDEVLANGGNVIIELGGHDFLKKQSRSSTKQDLVNLIERCENAGCRVLLCEIPRGFIVDPFFGLERELANEYDLDLMPDTMIRKLVLFSPHAPPGLWLPTSWHLSDDGLHPNANGNRMMAKTLARRLKSRQSESTVPIESE